ncbi:MAG: aminotransferase class V-fold PLP-dependent enzyme [Desulfobacteraceae bacterium]|nr:MAG: aminotransferase class V-fold PLP-dependent enzyme [Desulfobacteraceae bacterium]
MSFHYLPGHHFLQIPGPTNVPEQVLRAMAEPTIDHRGPRFAEMVLDIQENLRKVFKTSEPVIIFPSSGTGAWEAALVNTLSPGDKVLMFETGHFATLWSKVAERLGLVVDFVPGDWRRGVDPDSVKSRLQADRGDEIKAVAVVHNETSTGVTSRVSEIRQAIDQIGHGALLFVDTISSLGSMDFRHEEWKVDVTICCSQKGLMLPPGLGFNAVSRKAMEASASNGLHRSYWSWAEMLSANKDGFFPYTPATNLLFGLKKALDLLQEEGLDNVFDRHARHAEATRRAVRAWGLELQCLDEREFSASLTALRVPEGHNADGLRKVILEKFNMSLGNGLGKVAGKVFRIGHLGDFNDLMLMGTLCGVEMGLKLAGIPHKSGGAQAAMEFLSR